MGIWETPEIGKVGDVTLREGWESGEVIVEIGDVFDPGYKNYTFKPAPIASGIATGVVVVGALLIAGLFLRKKLKGKSAAVDPKR